MKKILALTLVLTMLMVNTVFAQGDNVQDAPASWAYEEVEKAIGEQLIPESMQGDYTSPITREEFCILAIRMIEVKSDMTIDEYLGAVGAQIAPIGTFSDCDTKEVRAAKVLGITDGVGDGKFAPNNKLTREQAAKFLTTTAMACGRSVSLSTTAYADIDEIGNWAKPYTGYVYDIDVMRGIGENKFNPKGSYQRQQAFVTMYRIWKAIDEVNLENVEVASENVEISGDTRTLLLYKVKTIDSDEAAAFDGMMHQIVYYSDASYEVLVTYFKSVLKETADYSVYVQEGRTSIDGTLNDEMVIVIVNDFMTTEPEVGMNGVNVNYYD